jgi:DEAD/DEAH box helicase domain-containing protein
LESVAQNTSLLLFPTKALSHDQLSKITLLTKYAFTFDGDTELAERASIRDTCQVLLTNPDMLHVAILPFHNLWKRFLIVLKYVMIDEIHYYQNQLGGHLSHLLMRLIRVCKSYGNDSIQFIACSATIPNPVEHFSNICHTPADHTRCISKDGSPQEAKYFYIWKSNPGYSLNESTVEVVTFLLYCNLKVIVFAKSRKQCELLYKELDHSIGLNERIKFKATFSYRGGYSFQERRRIEKDIFNGKVDCLVCTNALELGIDIGQLDAVVHVGLPLSISSYHQQAGRAGRRGNKSLDILIPNMNNYRDLFYLENPRELIFENNSEQLDIDLMDESILALHTNCAAQEIPIKANEELFWGEESIYQEAVGNLLYDQIRQYYIPAIRNGNHPAYCNPLRGTVEDEFELIDSTNNSVLELIPIDRVPFTLYQNAIHLYKGKPYIVFHINKDEKFAHCRLLNVDYITSPQKGSKYEPIAEDMQQNLIGVNELVHIGPVLKTVSVNGYKKLDSKTGNLIEIIESSIPTQTQFNVYGIWVDIPRAAENNVYVVNQSVHTIQHLIVKLLPIYSTMTKTSIYSACCGEKRTTILKRILVYDQMGRKGPVFKIAEIMKTLLERAYIILQNCLCLGDGGCMQCAFIDTCPTKNTFLSKKAAINLIELLIN